MKKQFFYLFTAICLAVCFTSCDKGDDPKDPGNTDAFTGYDNEKLDQEIFADDTETASGFAFTAKEAWSISIGDATKSTTDNSWVEVDPMNGDAGSHAINITLDLNYTGEDRVAEINIKAGESTITITVEQKGTTGEGKTPVKVISAIIDQADDETESYKFTYNSNNEIEKIEYTAEDKGGKEITEKIYTYSEGKIVSKGIYSDQGATTAHDQTITLNSDGNAISSDKPYSMGDLNWTDKTTWTYNNENYLSKIKYKETSHSTNEAGLITSYVSNITFNCSWESGNLTSAVGSRQSGTPQISSTTHTININYTTYENKSNVDIFTLMGNTGESFYLAFGTSDAGILKKCGQATVNLIDRITEIITSSESDSKYEKRIRFEYEFDKDRYVTRVIVYTSVGNESTERSYSYKIEYIIL